MFLDDEVSIRDLLQFAGLDAILAQLGQFVRLGLDGAARRTASGVLADGIHIQLAAQGGEAASGS